MMTRHAEAGNRRRSATEQLFRRWAGSRRRHWPTLRQTRAAYDAVWPCTLRDDDLLTFLSFLYATVRVLKPRVIVQTGTAAGTSTVAMALALRENGVGHLWTIDPEPSQYFGVTQPVAIARGVVRHARLDPFVTFVRGYSVVPLDVTRIRLADAPTWCLTTLPVWGQIDLLVVDGDHTVLGCYLDLSYGARGMNPAGPRSIVCHDYCGIPDVRTAVDLWRLSNRPSATRLVQSPCGILFMQL